jgi:uncharacterized protein (TIGR02001 family)
MTKIVLACVAVIAATAGSVAQAQTSSEHELSYNLGLVSDYTYRGISQTMRKPALQGGVDYTHTQSGFYAGAWASTIKWTKDAGGSGNVELDLYAGKTGEFGNGLSYDFGGLAYVYPGNDLDRVAGFDDANTFELYGQLGFGPAYIKYSHSLTDLFGVPNSEGSGYLDLGADFDVAGGYVLNLHAGRQMIRKNAGDYTDWKVGVTKDFGVAEASLAVIGTNVDLFATNGKNISKSRLVLSVSKTF